MLDFLRRGIALLSSDLAGAGAATGLVGDITEGFFAGVTISIIWLSNSKKTFRHEVC